MLIIVRENKNNIGYGCSDGLAPSGDDYSFTLDLNGVIPPIGSKISINQGVDRFKVEVIDICFFADSKNLYDLNEGELGSNELVQRGRQGKEIDNPYVYIEVERIN